jgi:hypothetical protein
MYTADQYAAAVCSTETRLDVIVDGGDALRLVAMFSCGCIATEPIGTGTPAVCVDACREHAEPAITHDRRSTG